MEEEDEVVEEAVEQPKASDSLLSRWAWRLWCLSGQVWTLLLRPRGPGGAWSGKPRPHGKRP